MITYDAKGNAVSFDGPEAVDVLAAASVASALRLYAKTKMKVNGGYTPAAMLAFVARTTGQTFKRGQYAEAAEALAVWVQRRKAEIPSRVKV